VSNEKKIVLNNYYNAVFLRQEFEKIYFIIGTYFNISLQNKNKYLRSHKAKYEKILIEKYNNNLKDFIDSEMIFAKNYTEQELVKEFLEFYKDILVPDNNVQLFNNNEDLLDDLFPDDTPIILIHD
jgi:hypothetical protein